MLNINDDDIHDIIFSSIDNLREMGHKIKEPDDEELERIYNEIYDDVYHNYTEDELTETIEDLILNILCDDRTTEEKLKEYLEDLSDITLFNMWNEYCRDENYDSVIYDIEEFDDIFQGNEPHNLACRVYYGDFCPQCDYFTFNAYGNLKSIDSYELKEYIYIDDLVDYIIRTDSDFGDYDIREILDE